MKPMQYTITPKFCRKAEKDLGHRSEMTKLMRNLMKPKLALKRNSQSYMIMTMKAAAMENRPSEEIPTSILTVRWTVKPYLGSFSSQRMMHRMVRMICETRRRIFRLEPMGMASKKSAITTMEPMLEPYSVIREQT